MTDTTSTPANVVRVAQRLRARPRRQDHVAFGVYRRTTNTEDFA
jgi:hypothetical protein